ncbi:MAG: LSM domain-containing protein [Candidatus Bathyarchaeia archaeon]
MEPSKKPLNLLVKRINQEVAVKLKNNSEYRGKMVNCDSHMNIILEGATEYKSDEPSANFGNIIVRGNNILYVCIEKPS